METTTSRFKWMEGLDKDDLQKAVSNLSLLDKLELVSEVLESDNHSENNLRVVIMAQSQIINALTDLLTNRKTNLN